MEVQGGEQGGWRYKETSKEDGGMRRRRPWYKEMESNIILILIILY